MEVVLETSRSICVYICVFCDTWKYRLLVSNIDPETCCNVTIWTLKWSFPYPTMFIEFTRFAFIYHVIYLPQNYGLWLTDRTGRHYSCGAFLFTLEERLYVLCNMNDIEDEIHMRCTCTLYQHIRIEMYNNVIHKYVNFHQLNNEQKCIYLVTTE